MAKANREQWLVQRRVTTGDVIVVQAVPRRQEPAASPRVKQAPSSEAGVEMEAPNAEESYRWWERDGVDEAREPDQPEAGTVMVDSGQSWPYTPAPEGYAYEFGTGRLIKVEEE